MSWRQLWGNSSTEESMEPALRFSAYWQDRLKEAYVKARVRCEAILFAVFLLGGLLLLKYSSLPIDRTTWLIGFGVFVVVFLFELCFLSPYQYAKTLIQERDSLDAQLNKLRADKLEEGKEMFAAAAEKIAQGTHPLRALQEVRADTLDTNDMLIAFCEDLQKHGHPHPFEDIAIKKECWLEFLQTARSRGLNLSNEEATLEWITEMFVQAGKIK